MKIFLTLKHWQLFVLFVGLPFLLELVMIVLSIMSRNGWPFLYIGPVAMILFMGLFFSWFYSLGTNLYKRLPPTAGMSLIRFKIFFFIPLIYITFLCLLLFFGIPSMLAAGTRLNPLIFLLIFPLHLFCMFCLFYCLYFIAKTLKAAERQTPVTFSDYVGEFFLMWFYPVGIWFIQPRINKLFTPSGDS